MIRNRERHPALRLILLFLVAAFALVCGLHLAGAHHDAEGGSLGLVVLAVGMLWMLPSLSSPDKLRLRYERMRGLAFTGVSRPPGAGEPISPLRC